MIMVISNLWLPILLSGVFVFIASSVIHMVIKWHAPNYKALPNEDAVRSAIQAANVAPGLYVLPHCADMKEMASEDMLKKYNDGPVGFLTLKANGAPKMGGALTQWFIFSLVIAFCGAIIAVQSFGLDSKHAHAAAHHIAVISFIAYGFGSICDAIWMGKQWSSVVKYLLDAAIYAAITAVTFYWLWP